MHAIRILTYNVRGLNTPMKRQKILRELKQYSIDIAFLQETHITLESRIRLYSNAYPEWYYGDTPIKGAKGVAIGMAKETQFQIMDRKVDPEGRYIFLKGVLKGVQYTFANIYCPNKNPEDYLKKLVEDLMEFREGRLIVAGDFNLCLDPEMDSTSHARGVRMCGIRRLKQQLHQNQLVDVWRIQHPEIKDYTYYSAVHKTYSRIDYIMIEHALLEHLVKTSIEIRTTSDHAPVIMEFTGLEPSSKKCNWRMNEDLLQDREIENKIKKEMKQFFKINETTEVSMPIVWETHKAYIRGILISEGARKKKERQKRRNKLIVEIYALEQQHKHRENKSIRH